MTWEPGDAVVLHEVWRERVWAARPMTVARDDGDTVALWFPKGTRWKAPTTPPARERAPSRGDRLASCAALGDWTFVDAEWDVDTLRLMQRDAWHSVWVSWLGDGTHWGWYVNLERPFSRTSCGFETMDYMLDVIVDPDGSRRLKDEDELDAFVAGGVFDGALAARVRAEARAAIERFDAKEPPFDEPWPEWRPDPQWRLPELPAEWNRLCR